MGVLAGDVACDFGCDCGGVAGCVRFCICVLNLLRVSVGIGGCVVAIVDDGCVSSSGIKGVEEGAKSRGNLFLAGVVVSKSSTSLSCMSKSKLESKFNLIVLIIK